MKNYTRSLNLGLFFVFCMANFAIGMEPIAEGLTGQAQKIHRDLLGKVKKLEGYDDIYVGAGYSAAGEPMFFAMEKLDDERAKIWEAYADALYQDIYGVIHILVALNVHCQSEKIREKFKKEGKLYDIQLMDIMCPNKERLSKTLPGALAGINGFYNMLTRQRSGDEIYVAYASTQPITDPFGPKKQIDRFPTPEEFEAAYADIIISIGVDMNPRTAYTEHRGIFKNPFFELKGTYKNIAMKLHGWAGMVEKQIFDKTYMTVWPTPPAATLLHRTVKPGDMYIGVDTEPYPYEDYEDKELRKKFPSIKQALINIQTSKGGSSGFEVLHVFDLNVLSKYYTESAEKK